MPSFSSVASKFTVGRLSLYLQNQVPVQDREADAVIHIEPAFAGSVLRCIAGFIYWGLGA